MLVWASATHAAPVRREQGESWGLFAVLSRVARRWQVDKAALDVQVAEKIERENADKLRDLCVPSPPLRSTPMDSIACAHGLSITHMRWMWG